MPTARSDSRRCASAAAKAWPWSSNASTSAVDRGRRRGLREQVAHDRADLARFPARGLVDHLAVLPTVGNAELAAFDLEHATGHAARIEAAQPDDQRRHVLRRHLVER